LKGIFLKAFQKQQFELNFIQLRDFSHDKHHKVDDYPFGEHLGMLLKPDVILSAIQSIENYAYYRIIYPCPKGSLWTQSVARQCLNIPGIIFLIGYYEGIDERLFEILTIERFSVGDYILSSGELPALIFAESIIRLIPNVVGNPKSIQSDSIISGLLEHPHYTAPREFQGVSVPDVIVSGNHQKRECWQKRASLKDTLYKKPSLLTDYPVSQEEQKILTEIILGGNS